MSSSYKCLKSIGFCLLVLWFFVFISFLISYAFTFVIDGWGYVGWIVPLFCCFILIMFFSFSLSFLSLIRVKEIFKKQSDVTIGFFDKASRFLDKKWLTNLSVATFWITMLLFILLVWSWVFFILFGVVCFSYDFIKNR